MPNVRSEKAKGSRAAGGAAEAGRFTPVWFEAGYYWPEDEQRIPTEELAPPAHPGLAKAGARGIQQRDLPAAPERGGLTIPILGLRTMSEQNEREHWRTRASRTKHQKEVVTLVLHGSQVHRMKGLMPLVVTMTRVAPSNGLDTDNMVSSQKHVRDAIAKVLGVDDKDPCVEWRVEQRKGPWGVEIHVAAR